MEENETNLKKGSSKGLIVVIVILVLIVVGMGLYIAYDKGIIFSSVDKEEKEAKSTKKEVVSNDSSDEDVVKDLDLTKCLNNTSTNVSYSNASSDINSNYGLSMNIDSDNKSVTLTINWETFGPLSTASSWSGTSINYKITGFTKKVKEVFVGELGQDSMGITLFYIMEDKTVEYTPMFVMKYDSQNNSYYDMNYTYEYSADNSVTGQHFETKGPISNVNNVIKLYTADYSITNGTGARTTIGATKDGSFYDLGIIINN